MHVRNFTKHEPIVGHTFRSITVKEACHLGVRWEVEYLILALQNSQIIVLLRDFFFLDSWLLKMEPISCPET